MNAACLTCDTTKDARDGWLRMDSNIGNRVRVGICDKCPDQLTTWDTGNIEAAQVKAASARLGDEFTDKQAKDAAYALNERILWFAFSAGQEDVA